jgi:hypothetical protein
MAVYLVTGKLGSGKSLCAVDRVRDYISRKRRVVTNFWCDLAPISRSNGGPVSHARIEVIPARPTSLDLARLGRGGASEHDAGLLILDECGTFLNARKWNEGDRQGVIDWLLHSRKLGWDVILICQSLVALDKQVREMVCEYLVTCRRMDRVNIPVISWIFPIKFPRVHFATVRYGLGPHDMRAETWVYRGNNLFACYSTEWMSKADCEDGWCTVLPPALSKHRYDNRPTWRDRIRSWLSGAPPARPSTSSPRRCHTLLSVSDPDRRWQVARELVAAGAL